MVTTWLKVFTVIIVVIFLLLILIDKIAGYLFVWDYADIMFARPYKYCKIKAYDEIRNLLRKYPDKPISIAGGKFSHGGHTFIDNCIYLDMVDMNEILYFNEKNKILVVQAGATWRQILEFLDPYNLSVKAMQSYANFTVGGAISVNAHGRGIEFSTVGSTIQKLKVMLADGTIVDIYPGDELFRGVLGGYGGIAIILEANISLIEN